VCVYISHMCVRNTTGLIESHVPILITLVYNMCMREISLYCIRSVLGWQRYDIHLKCRKKKLNVYTYSSPVPYARNYLRKFRSVRTITYRAIYIIRNKSTTTIVNKWLLSESVTWTTRPRTRPSITRTPLLPRRIINV